ncbi:MAG: DNA polymerase domain-containing protein, partial [Promethearchaeota archaeon]
LGEEKYQHEEIIHEMEPDILAWYNLKDSLLTLDLTKFNNSLVWNLIILLCRITKMPIHDMVRRQISTWIQNIFYFEHRRKGYLIPRRSEIGERKKGGILSSKADDDKFMGAYVVPPIPGIHYDVVVMDFASLYPSIIKEYNLSYETVQCPHEDDEDNLVRGTPYHICTHKMGIFSYVVGFFRDIRVKYFKPKSSDKSSTEKQRNYYQTIQQALKVFINGSYGVFGSPNFPLFCLPVAESTTGIGQYSIKQTIKKAEELGVKVLYGDTDSVFLDNPSKKQMKDISNWSKKELDLDLEEEKTYQFLALSDRKKNYIGIYKDSKYTDIKGLVVKKKNTPNFIKKAFSEMIEILKNITNDEEFSKARNTIIEIVKGNLKKIGKPNTFTLEDYAINIGIQKNLKDYTKVIPQHIRAAIELRDATGKEYQKGETISFIKSKGSIGAKALELAKLQDIDPKKYRELLKSALEQVLDALGITFDEIKGIKKMDAFF